MASLALVPLTAWHTTPPTKLLKLGVLFQEDSAPVEILNTSILVSKDSISFCDFFQYRRVLAFSSMCRDAAVNAEKLFK